HFPGCYFCTKWMVSTDMNIEQKQIGTLDVSVAQIPVARIDPMQLKAVPVDQRVAALASVLESRMIGVVPCLPGELLDEPRDGLAARTRPLGIGTFAEAMNDGRSTWWDPENRARAGLQLFADSLPDCMIELRTTNDGCLGPSGEAAGSLVFFPLDIYLLVNEV